MHVQYDKKRLFEKEKTFSSNRETIHYFFLWTIAFKTHLRPNWEIQMDWENDVLGHQIRSG